MKTFKELESLAYMSNLPKIAAVYAQLDDSEVDEDEIERFHAKLEYKCKHYEEKVFQLKNKIKKLEDVLKKIEDILNE